MFPKEKEGNKHTECVHIGEDHTAVDHKYEECSYRTNLAANYLEHIFNTQTHSYFLDVQAKQNMDIVEDNKQIRKYFYIYKKKKFTA